MQPNITWRESILRTQVLLFDGLSEMQAQIGVIIIIIVSDSEDNNNDNNEEREKAVEVAKINITRVTR